MSQKVFFKGLNEIRAIAALAVVFHHIELYSSRNGRYSWYNNEFVKYFVSHCGEFGVYIFFVLSGFLITYLLLNEKENGTGINIRKFYLRRIFRIWPLYFIILLLSLFAVPLALHTTFFDQETYYMGLIENPDIYSRGNILLYALLLSNFAFPMVGASQSWSVSVEEQFYIVWPHIIKHFSQKNLLYVFIFLFVFLRCYKKLHLPFYQYLKKIPLEIMVIGGVCAYFWFYYKERLERYFASNKLFFANMVLVLIGLFFPVPKLIVAILFAFTILFVITERNFNLRSSVLSFLGVISYGIYMYHPMMMFISSAVSNRFFRNDDVVYKILFYVLTLGLTFITSYFSYHLIEKKLINFKDKKFSNAK